MTQDGQEKRVWAAVEFEVDADKEDLAGWLPIFCGATGCQLTPISEGRVLVHATFDKSRLAEHDVEKLRTSLEEYGLAPALHTLRLKTIEEEDWLAEWKKGFEPFASGECLLVCPPWCRDNLTDAQIGTRKVLLLEPGMAFGTGLHATTRYCMRAMERFPTGEDVLDVGTGSGILAIACALIHPAARIVAVDVDPVAIRVARENFELNGVATRVDLREGSTEELDDQAYDCILSNLTCEDIIALLLEYLRLLRPDGTIIGAGILKEKLPLLERALESYPLSIIDCEVDDTWAGVTLSRIPVTIRTM